MKKCIHTFKIENMPLQPSTIYFCPWQMSQSAFLPVKPYILIGNHVRVKSSGLARGLANARPPGSATFANAPPPGLTRRANAPQLPGGGLGAGGIDWCINTVRQQFWWSILYTPHNILFTIVTQSPFLLLNREFNEWLTSSHKQNHKWTFVVLPPSWMDW